MPVRCDTAWNQKEKAQAHGMIALPPNHTDLIGKVVFRLTDLPGATLGEFQAKAQPMVKEGNFARAFASWPDDLAPPGAHHVTVIIYDKRGEELTRIAPRLVSTSMRQGY